MEEDKYENQHTDVELDFDEDDLKDVAISDTTLEEDDEKSKQASKKAKKEAKKHLSPEEKKALKRKKLLIAGGIVAVLVIILGAVPFTRWPILNAVGFRANLTMTIQEQTSKKPISRVTVKLEDGTFGTTDQFGRVTFNQTKLGKRTVLAQKAGYGDETTTVINGLGTTKAAAQLKVIGIKLDLDIKDWLSEGALAGATVKFGEKNTAESDKTGRASIVIPPTDNTKVELEVSAPGYITKKITTETSAQSREVALVSAQKNYFVSKRDGKFDIFSSNLDGSDQRKIIEATGKEDEGLLQFSINKNNKQAILVSNRDGKIQNGRVVAGIYSVDLERASLTKVDEGSDVQLLDWSDNTTLYTKSSVDLNYDDPTFSRIIMFNSTTNKLSTVVEANYFPVSIVAQNKLFYLPADAYRPIQNGVLTSQDINSGAKKTYLAGKQISYATRAGYSSLELQDNASISYELQIASGATKVIDRRPSASLTFVTSPNGLNTLWSDRRDGQGALLLKVIKNNDEKLIVKSGGLTNPVRFISDGLAIVRVATSQETADYVVHLGTGKIGKVVDVSNVGTVRTNGL